MEYGVEEENSIFEGDEQNGEFAVEVATFTSSFGKGTLVCSPKILSMLCLTVAFGDTPADKFSMDMTNIKHSTNAYEHIIIN